MKNLLIKELKLAIQPISFFFLAAVLLTLVPGYPILLGSFFICLGLFQSFVFFREANDILYTTLLPIRKADAVKAKYLSVLFIELLGFLGMAVFTVLRMTVLSNGEPYVTNALMNPSPFFLAGALVIFLEFNLIFLGGFFRTAYKVGVPFIIFIVVSMLTIGALEALHFFPGLSFLNTTTGERLPLQFGILAGAVVIFALGTWLSEKASEKRFEAIDL